MMPNWYGIEAIKYEWRGPWEEPILHYKGHTFDGNDIEDGLWQMYLDDDWNTDDWEHYVNNNAINYLEDIIFATESEG